MIYTVARPRGLIMEIEGHLTRSLTGLLGCLSQGMAWHDVDVFRVSGNRSSQRSLTNEEVVVLILNEGWTHH